MVVVFLLKNTPTKKKTNMFYFGGGGLSSAINKINAEIPGSYKQIMTRSFADGILKDHVAFVTGGGTGITGGVARALAEAGAGVALVSRQDRSSRAGCRGD